MRPSSTPGHGLHGLEQAPSLEILSMRSGCWGPVCSLRPGKFDPLAGAFPGFRPWTLNLGAFSSAAAASYVVSVRRASVLLTASFGFGLATNTLAVRLALPLAGCALDSYQPECALPGAHSKRAVPGCGTARAGTGLRVSGVWPRTWTLSGQLLPRAQPGRQPAGPRARGTESSSRRSAPGGGRT